MQCLTRIGCYATALVVPTYDSTTGQKREVTEWMAVAGLRVWILACRKSSNTAGAGSVSVPTANTALQTLEEVFPTVWFRLPFRTGSPVLSGCTIAKWAGSE